MIERRSMAAAALMASLTAAPARAEAPVTKIRFTLDWKIQGIHYASLNILQVAPNLQEQMLLQRQVDAIAVFSATSYMNLVSLRRDPEKDFRWFFYADHGIDL